MSKKIDLSNVKKQVLEKYNIVGITELKLSYIDEYNLDKNLKNHVLLICVKNLKEIFIRSGLYAEKQHRLKPLINYDWNTFLPKNYTINNIKKKVHNLKFSDKLIINVIKIKNIFYTKIVFFLYKIFYKIS